MAVQGKLLIHEITQEKELWEGVSQIVHSSFRNVANTMHNIKRWTERTEFELRTAEKDREALGKRLTEMERQGKNNSARLNFLLVYISALFGRMHKRTSSQKKYLKQQIDASQAFYRHFCGFLGVEMPGGPGGHFYADGIEPEDFREDVSAQYASTFEETFDSWRRKQAEANAREAQTSQTLDELRELSERSREKLIAWRETLHSNAYLVESLSDSLLSTQQDLSLMKRDQVTPEQIEATIGETSAEIEQKVQEVSGALDELKSAIQADKKVWDQRLESVNQEVDARVDRHGNEVMTVLKKNINPMTAYLNSIHVKVDAARHRLGELDIKVPELTKGLAKVTDDLDRKGEETSTRFKGTRKQLEDLLERVDGHDGKFLEEREYWESSAQASQAEVGGRVDDLSVALGRVKDLVENVEHERVVNVEEAISTLDSKVAKWVQARPLPAKISEARLFALESRLNEETDARHDLEARLEEASRSLEFSQLLPAQSSVFGSKQNSHEHQAQAGPWPPPQPSKPGMGGPPDRARGLTQASGAGAGGGFGQGHQLPFDASASWGSGVPGAGEQAHQTASPRFAGGYRRQSNQPRKSTMGSPRGSLAQAGVAATLQKGALKPVQGERQGAA